MAFSMAWNDVAGGDSGAGAGAARDLLAGFRGELYRCLTLRPDALFELADAVLCEGGRVTDLARLSLAVEFRRGHGALYDGLNQGRADFARLRVAVAGLPLPAWADGRIRLAADVTNWLRPDAATSPQRMFCHVKGRGRSAGQVIPGWPYSFVAALGPGASSWALPLDAVRLGPGDDETMVTAAQLRAVTGRLIAAGHWKDGDPDIIIALDSGYSATRLAWLLEGLPVLLVVRVRSDRVFHGPPGPRPAGARGRPGRHSREAVRCAAPGDGPGAQATAAAVSPRHGPLEVSSWHRLHQKLERSSPGWEGHPGELPVIGGTLIWLAAAGQAGRPAGTGPWSRCGYGHRTPRRARAWSRRSGRRTCAGSTSNTCSGSSSPASAGQAHAPRPRRRRPLDLADHRLLRPALGRPPHRRPDPAALAATPAPRRDDPRPGPRRVPPRPRGRRHTRQPAETRQARPRPPTGIEEQDPGTRPARRQTPPQTRQAPEELSQQDKTDRLNGKLGPTGP